MVLEVGGDEVGYWCWGGRKRGDCGFDGGGEGRWGEDGEGTGLEFHWGVLVICLGMLGGRGGLWGGCTDCSSTSKLYTSES